MLSENIPNIIESLKLNDIKEVKLAILNFKGDKYPKSTLLDTNKKYHDIFENNYYHVLSFLLRLRKFKYFRQLLDFSDKVDVFIDVEKIPNRLEIISKLHYNYLRAFQFGKIIDLTKFLNSYDLLERKLSQEELKPINEIKKDKIVIANLEDLFGNVSDSLIHYVLKTMVDNIFKFLVQYLNSSEAVNYLSQMPLTRRQLLWQLDGYPMYGLSIQKIGRVKRFLRVIQDNQGSFNEFKQKGDSNLYYLNYGYNKTHLISLNNLKKNDDKLRNYKDEYKFYNMSMVLLGGLGPQGHGFTYSTPLGEVVEVCSDRKENEAIIIKYKEFLKQQFLKRLKEEMIEKSIEEDTITNIIEFLSGILNPDDKINYYDAETIIKQIWHFLKEKQDPRDVKTEELKELIERILHAIERILRPIDIIDQFKCRMDLIDEDKIKSEDIAKLTSLREKSHYDVLRERLFLQTQIKTFWRQYSTEIKKLRKQLF